MGRKVLDGGYRERINGIEDIRIIIAMKSKEYLAFLNVAGAVSSILALLLTLSQNVTIAFMIKALVSIVFFIATTGTLGAFAYNLNKRFIKSEYWPYHLLYWMILGMTIIFFSLIIASVSYMLTTALVQIFAGMINDIQTGYI